jgi:uncharacterized repeat protein (TIGR03833 family)
MWPYTSWGAIASVAGNGKLRSDVRPGMIVDIVLKQNQRTGKLTRGVVKDILTNSQVHPHGIKVRLQDGQVGRVQVIVEANDNRQKN